MNEQGFHRLLEQQAATTIADIVGDNPDVTDTGTETYVTEIPHSRHMDLGQGFVGAIYAGELGTWCYAQTGSEAIEPIFLDQQDMAELWPHIFGEHGIYGPVFI